MINGIEGIPGSGKSYEAVVYHVLVALQVGRRVITNLPLLVDMFAAIDPSYRALLELRRRPRPVLGTWDAERVDEDGKGEAFELFPDGRKQAPGEGVSVFGHVWDFYTTWKHPETGQGPLFIIDECHVPFPSVGTDKSVVEWFKLHRHFNVDVLLMTQSFRDMNQPVARLIAMLVICRKADILGKKGTYIRKVKAGYRGAVISTEERPYKPQFFPLYKSHTQGNSVAESAASDVTPSVIKFRRITRLVWTLAVVVLGYAGVSWAMKEEKPPTPMTFPTKRTAPADTEVLVSDVDRADAGLRPLPRSVKEEMQGQPVYETDHDPEPFKGLDVHLLGQIQLGDRMTHSFAVSKGGKQIFTMVTAELEQAGYEFKPKMYCAGVLVYAGKARPVTCDAPAFAAGSTSKPVVFDSGARVMSKP